MIFHFTASSLNVVHRMTCTKACIHRAGRQVTQPKGHWLRENDQTNEFIMLLTGSPKLDNIDLIVAVAVRVNVGVLVMRIITTEEYNIGLLLLAKFHPDRSVCGYGRHINSKFC